MKPQSSLITQLLFDSIKVPPKGSGRVIRFDESDIDIEIATGTLPERVITLLSKVKEPLTVSEIARAIGSNASRVSTTLKSLVKNGAVQPIVVEGCHREFVVKDEQKNFNCPRI